MTPDEDPWRRARDAPFPLFGLSHAFGGPRQVASVGGRHDGPVSHVSLGHGDRGRSPHRWVEIGVVGPLHGSTRARAETGGRATWTLDPTSVPLQYLATAANPGASGREIPSLVRLLLADGWGALELDVDGQPLTFRSLRRGAHWMALIELAPDHLLYVCASHVLPADTKLQRVTDLAPYTTDLS